jgi:hypothetical protein
LGLGERDFKIAGPEMIYIGNVARLIIAHSFALIARLCGRCCAAPSDAAKKPPREGAAPIILEEAVRSPMRAKPMGRRRSSPCYQF